MPSITWELRSFDSLSGLEVYRILQLRSEVFVVEQDCVYQDMDGRDEDCLHLIGWWPDCTPVAYARLLAPGQSYEKYSSIGRILSSEKVRGTGAGRELVRRSIDHCHRLYPGPIKISAQCYLDRFYCSFGFEHTGKEYLEDGIPHQEMVLRLAVARV